MDDPLVEDTPVSGDLVRLLLQQLSVVQQRFERAFCRELGIDRTSLDIVYQLIASGPSTPSQLARVTGLSAAVATQVVQRLEAGNHVRRAPHPRDGRKVLVSVAPDTSQRAWEFFAPVIGEIDMVVTQLDDASKRTVVAFLQGVVLLYRAHLAQDAASE